MDIRNICLLGHGGTGKTSLVESMLFLTGVTDRMGKTSDGNTVCDYDAEEIKRQISISMAMAPVTYQGVKINVLDTPGNFDFAGEMQSALRAAELGVLVCASKDGLSVGAERCWKYLKQQKKPCMIYISKEDEENANFTTTLEALRGKFGNSLAPVVVPIWDENKRTIGIIDVLNKKAYKVSVDKKAKSEEIPIPDGKMDVVEEFYGQLMEAVAETSEEYMEKYFSGEPFTKEEILSCAAALSTAWALRCCSRPLWSWPPLPWRCPRRRLRTRKARPWRLPMIPAALPQPLSLRPSPTSTGSIPW